MSRRIRWGLLIALCYSLPSAGADEVFRASFELPRVVVDRIADTPAPLLSIFDENDRFLSVIADESLGAGDESVPIAFEVRTERSGVLLRFPARNALPLRVSSSDMELTIEYVSPTRRRVTSSEGEIMEFDVASSLPAGAVDPASKRMGTGSDPKTQIGRIVSAPPFAIEMTCNADGNESISLMQSARALTADFEFMPAYVSAPAYKGPLLTPPEGPLGWVATANVHMRVWTGLPILSTLQFDIGRGIELIDGFCDPPGNPLEPALRVRPYADLDGLQFALDSSHTLSKRFRRNVGGLASAIDYACSIAETLKSWGVDKLALDAAARNYNAQLGSCPDPFFSCPTYTNFNGYVRLFAPGMPWTSYRIEDGVPRVVTTLRKLPLYCDEFVNVTDAHVRINAPSDLAVGYAMGYFLSDLAAPNSATASATIKFRKCDREFGTLACYDYTFGPHSRRVDPATSAYFMREAPRVLQMVRIDGYDRSPKRFSDVRMELSIVTKSGFSYSKTLPIPEFCIDGCP